MLAGVTVAVRREVRRVEFGTYASFSWRIFIGFHSPPPLVACPVLQLPSELGYVILDLNRLCDLLWRLDIDVFASDSFVRVLSFAFANSNRCLLLWHLVLSLVSL